MAFHSGGSCTVVEFGTSKVCALHGGRDRNGNPVVLGFGQKECEGCIVKGDIVDFPAVSAALSAALEAADRSAGESFDRMNVFFTVSGAGTYGKLGEGNVFIYDEDREVKPEHVEEAVGKANNLPPPPGEIMLNAYDSYFVIDSKRRVKAPCGQAAKRLDAYIHVIFSDLNRAASFRMALKEQGFEGELKPVFSGVASAYGTLSKDEKEHGALLVDLGAGLTEYILVKDDGIVHSGVVSIGMENVANDLAVGLELPIQQCRKLLWDGRLETTRREGRSFVELSGQTGGAIRRIPFGSFEKIMELRLRELFSIVKEELEMKGFSGLISAGGVLSGGGAKLSYSTEIFKDVFGFHARVGDPFEISGAMTGLESPRYTSVLGLLKHVFESGLDGGASGGGIGIGSIMDSLEGFTKGMIKKLNTAKGAIKI